MAKKYLLAWLFLMVLTPLWLQADPAEHYLQLGLNTEIFGYKEFDEQNRLLDREDGVLPGLHIELGQNLSRMSAALRFEVSGGRVDYSGQTQSGVPLTTQTDERIIVVEGLLRFKGPALSESPMRLIAGLGYRQWQRNIRATQNTTRLFEVYGWRYLSFGVEAPFWRRGHWSAAMDVRWLKPLQPTMQVDIPGFDSATLKLQARNSAALAIPIRFVAQSGRIWTVSPYWQSWRMARSAPEPLTVAGVVSAATVTEPRNNTNIVGLRLSLQWAP
jgi:hypothetical protein